MKIKDITKLKWKFPDAELILDSGNSFHFEFKMNQDGKWIVVIVEDTPNK